MAAPPSLGDQKQAVVRIQETHELPVGRKAIVGKFEQILSTGGIQKVVVEVGKPIRVDRFVSAAEAPKELPPPPEDDLLSAIRNSEIIEFSNTTGEPYRDLFKAFYLLTRKKCVPYAILVNTLDQLDTWLDLEKLTHLEELFAVEVRPSPAVEANVLLLAAGTREEPDVISTTIKLYMDKGTPA